MMISEAKDSDDDDGDDSDSDANWCDNRNFVCSSFHGLTSQIFFYNGITFC